MCMVKTLASSTIMVGKVRILAKVHPLNWCPNEAIPIDYEWIVRYQGFIRQPSMPASSDYRYCLYSLEFKSFENSHTNPSLQPINKDSWPLDLIYCDISSTKNYSISIPSCGINAFSNFRYSTTIVPSYGVPQHTICVLSIGS